jgi:thymidylate synthase (FAD)
MHVELISITPHPEKVIESAGRTAYLSFDKKTDLPVIKAKSGEEMRIFRVEDYPTLSSIKVGEQFSVNHGTWQAVQVWNNSAEKFIEMLIRSGHLSVLEHASATFRIIGGSRAFTHQLVRHRMASFTQQSQRYISEDQFQYIEPLSIQKNAESHKIYVDFMEQARKVYHQLQEIGIGNEDARFVLPNSVESEIVITADLRDWRHIVEIRGAAKAQWEIRQIIVEILKILKRKAPSIFYDLEVDPKRGVIIKKRR